MTLTPSDAERLARIVSLGLNVFEWNKRSCGDYIRYDFRLEHFYDKARVGQILPEAGDPGMQAAALNQESFNEWHRQNWQTHDLTEAETVSWLLAEAHRFQPADVAASLERSAHVDFAVPLTYRYDWHGVLQIAGVLQTGVPLEERRQIYLPEPPRWSECIIRTEWRTQERDYHITATEVTPSPEPTLPCVDEFRDVDGLGAFFKEHYNYEAAREWLHFAAAHRSPASNAAVEELRAEYAIPLNEEDCQTFLQGLRNGHVWLIAGDLSTDARDTVLYEDGKYLRQQCIINEVTGIGGNVLYEGPMQNNWELTEEQVIQLMKSTLGQRHRLLKVLSGWNKMPA